MRLVPFQSDNMLLPFEKKKHRIFTANSKKILNLWEERAHVFKHPAVLVLLLQKWKGHTMIDYFLRAIFKSTAPTERTSASGGRGDLYNNASEGTTIITKLWVHILTSSLENSNQFGSKSSFCSESEWTKLLKWRISVQQCEVKSAESLKRCPCTSKSGISGWKHHLGAGDFNSCERWAKNKKSMVFLWDQNR